MTEMLFHGYLTNQNESFNNLIMKYEPKIINFPQTYPQRIFMAFLEKEYGMSWIQQLLQLLDISVP